MNNRKRLLRLFLVISFCIGTTWLSAQTVNKDFKEQLDIIYDTADVKNKDLKVSASDKYLVLSTCREEDETIRANLYLRQIPDSEMSDFVAKHGKDLEYTPTR